MSIGKIVQVIGAVVDIEFPREEMPKVYDALVLEKDENNKLAEEGLTFEVQQQLGDGIVRTIAMGSSEGLQRGMAVKALGHGIQFRSARRLSAVSWTFSDVRLMKQVRSAKKSVCRSTELLLSLTN